MFYIYYVLVYYLSSVLFAVLTGINFHFLYTVMTNITFKKKKAIPLIVHMEMYILVKSKSVSPSVVSNSFHSMDCSLQVSSAHGIPQGSIMEWVAIPFSRGSSQLRDKIQVSCNAGRFLTI